MIVVLCLTQKSLFLELCLVADSLGFLVNMSLHVINETSIALLFFFLQFLDLVAGSLGDEERRAEVRSRHLDRVVGCVPVVLGQGEIILINVGITDEDGGHRVRNEAGNHAGEHLDQNYEQETILTEFSAHGFDGISLLLPLLLLLLMSMNPLSRIVFSSPSTATSSI